MNLPTYSHTQSAGCAGTIADGETRTCTIVNDDRPTTFSLTKNVINDNGGSAQPTAWTLTANEQPFVSGAVVSVVPGSFTLAELGGPSGYTPSSWACVGGTLTGDVVTVPANTPVQMIVTGFMLWNPVATARFRPGQWIPAAQVIHGGEALLAILAVPVWHFYSVHLRQSNRSMYTGYMTEPEMEHEHPLELERIKAGRAQPEADPAQRMRRQRVFLPVAGALAVLLLAGIYWFVTFEQTAIETLPVK